ncbi:hypothetical protein CDV55_103991 [Aspergillus turcosus]|nr:hypothetical protein CDV55_103991 [Aspergillus turcosus]
MASSRKVVAVFGATGRQGGSVARSLLKNGQFEVLCVTRNSLSPRAQELQALGARVVQGDGSDRTRMCEILKGTWGAFINNGYTNSPEVRSGRYDLDFGNQALVSAAAAGVKHVVFSSQPSAEDLSNGKIRTPILDIKAYGEKWGRECPQFVTFTPVMASWYLEDFLMPNFCEGFGGFPWTEDEQGYLTFKSPLIGGNERVPWISVEDDFGDLVHGIFLNPLRWNKRTVQAAADIVSFSDIVAAFVSVTRRKARFIPLTCSEFPDLDREEMKESRDVFAFYQSRNGEVFGNGITETDTAAELKRLAGIAKGGKGKMGLTTCREWFEKHFSK